MLIKNFKQNDIVEFNDGVCKGYGKVVGSFSDAGLFYDLFIIEILSSNITNEEYQYSHLVWCEYQMKLKGSM